jgi:hypothetical protein
MNPIPHLVRKECEADPYYKKCCLTGKESWEVKIDWHHAFDYSGTQINEKWAIMPIWWYMHSSNGDEKSVHNSKKTREFVQYLSLLRATPEDLAKYPKKNWIQIFNYLRQKHGQKETSQESKKS